MAEPSAGPNRHLSVYVRFCKALVFAVLLPIVVLAVAWLGSVGSAQAGVRVEVADGLPAGGASPTTTPCALQWRAIERSNMYQWEGMAAIGPNDIWVVGHKTLIEHWDGFSWSVVTSPIPYGDLYSVDAAGPNDVWAVGTSGSETLIMHWDGISWSRVPSPTPYNGPILYDVEAIGPNDAWAVGLNILHWNGTTWSVMVNPISTSYTDVSAVSANDVWVVGTNQQFGYSRTHTEHWNGTTWSIVPSPNPSTTGNSLQGVKAVSANDVWAVGSYFDTMSSTLTMHWNGTSWSVVPSPNVNPGISNGFDAVEALSSTDVWTVGSYDTGTSHLAMSAHWNGAAWTLVPVDNIDPTTNTLNAMAVIGPSDIWAAGTAIQHYSTICTPPLPTITPSITPSATNTPTITNTPTVTDTPTATGTPVCLYSWHEVLSQNVPSSYTNHLFDVFAVSAHDVWAVGQSSDEHNNRSKLVEHWDGEAWTLVPTPGISARNSALYGVWASASNDVWAVGSFWDVPFGTLTLHWDGTAWSIVTSPNPAIVNSLNAVAGASSDDVWAVGSTILHWDGTQWNEVPQPNAGSLYDISVLAANDIWAVGTAGSGTPPYQTLTVHWNGVEWSVVPSPNIGNANNRLNAVVAISANDVWAVGSEVVDDNSGDYLNLAMHWDGTQWILTNVPSFDAWNELTGLAAFSTNDVWAVGFSDSASTNSETVAMHWDGTQWSRVISPSPAGDSYLQAVASVPEGEMWAVGSTGGPVDRTLIERYSSTTFSDIPQGHTFYPYINCIACRGIALGYPDGTFRSNNPITRGQIAKLVVIASRPIGAAAEIMQPSGGQLFQDVPPGSTFYDYVQAIGGVVEGYPCGGPGEPCVPPGDLPYYRPCNTASRGQLTKIVSEVAGFNDQIPVGTQTFADVVEGSTFYVFIERLILNRPGVMVGYPCGGYGEPCDLQNRAYFRPANTVTRGQAAKIVANTFFPNCQPPAP